MIVWHYTTGRKARLIFNDGGLKPAIANVLPPERPIIWFSSAGYFEKTALKGLQSDEGYRTATITEMIELADGVYRFGRPFKGLLCAEPLRKASKMMLSEWRRLAKTAKAVGASEHDWWGSVDDFMSIEGMQVQKMNSDMKWSPISDEDVAALKG